MTSLQLSVLARAAQQNDILPGTALLYEQQFGKMRQVRWLVSRKLAYVRYGRLIANKTGRRVLAYQIGNNLPDYEQMAREGLRK